jgi:lipopolysaccharide export system permease protein
MSEVPINDLLDPHPALERDRGKWIAEAYKRLTAPLATMSYAMVGLLSALGGQFRRHGTVLRPMVAIGAMVVLLAVGLAFGSIAARDNRLIFLLWVQAILPGVVCGWLLLLPSIRAGAVPVRRTHQSAPAAV